MPIEVDSESVASSPARLRRWRHIRSVAIELFADQSFGAVSVDDIAAAAGVSRRTYFNYFATKTGVLFDPDPGESERLAGLLGQRDNGSELWGTLTESLTDYLREQELVVSARRAILSDDPSLDPLHMLANSHFEHSILHWLDARGEDPRSARLTAAIALAVVRVTFRDWNVSAGYPAFIAALRAGFGYAGHGMRRASERPEEDSETGERMFG